MKKFVTAVMLLSLLFTLIPSVSGAAAVAPKLYLNGKLLNSNAEPRYVGQSTLVPVRTVSEGLGFNVDWSDKIVNVSDGNNAIVLTINSKTAIVNDREVSLDAPAIADKGTTLVPLRFVSEQLGLNVVWDKLTQSVHLYQQDQPEVPTTPLPDPGTPGGGSDGSGGSPTDPNEGSGGTPGTTPGTGTNATLTAIDFDGLGSIYLSYGGDIGSIKTEVLHNPERIVFDLPNAAFAPLFTPGFNVNESSSLGEIVVDTHASLQKIRYSLYSDKPSTIRVVLDVTAETPVNVVREDGLIRLDVLAPTGPIVPPNTETPPANGIFKVVIDAGHGGKDPGAPAVNGRHEKEFNLAVALKVKALLDKEPKLKGYMTRANDTFIELDGRVKIANDLKADLFVSIHANRASSASVTGTETYYTRANSKEFANIMHKHLVTATGFKDRSVRTANFRVIKYTTMPAVLLEVGYLSNKSDTAALYTEAKQNRIAEEIVAAMKEYLKVK
ncbi:N-acetylmuramoyl-L-alanine amidase [Paenibacillus mendelii]|uniref:N-acetylmuramoyl-L-alanine amidase n=1 Tax=Paenibacillus mendelii TaxID=206163 RepID=A0ABV6J838_9BACL|nr:N-acetylmuramoyl-L-alanine amidase [Paenibacillus mendelii]MCQ6560320.1 N-acetylmuramoyl-L-alanine amidase [Paenibacillus mendelii]